MSASTAPQEKKNLQGTEEHAPQRVGGAAADLYTDRRSLRPRFADQVHHYNGHQRSLLVLVCSLLRGVVSIVQRRQDLLRGAHRGQCVLLQDRPQQDRLALRPLALHVPVLASGRAGAGSGVKSRNPACAMHAEGWGGASSPPPFLRIDG